MNTSRKIYFVTGTFINSNSWDTWRNLFEAKGYEVIIPIWPFKEGTTETLRAKHPDSILGSLTFNQLLDFYTQLIIREEKKPIAIGHSLGGLIVQILLQNNLLSKGVAIHSMPPKGVFTFQYSFFKSLWRPFGVFKSKDLPHLMTLEEWQYAFTNSMDFKEQKESYDNYLIPESRRIIRSFLRDSATVDFDAKKNPLLFVAGSNDHMMPPRLNFLNFKKYKNSKSITDYKEFEDVNHFVLGGTQWLVIADYILNWLKQHDGNQ